MRRLGARSRAAESSRAGRGACVPDLALPPQPVPLQRSLQLAMESLAFPRCPGPAPSAAAALPDGLKSPKPLMKKQAVKRHHHKHNLRHRYEFLETLGKGTYGKVKKARESSGRLVSAAPSRGSGPAGSLGLGRRRLGRGLVPCSVEWPHSVYQVEVAWRENCSYVCP